VKVCALIAAFNEEPSIGAVVEGVRRFVPDVVVVDDGSTDRTAACAAAAGAFVLTRPDNGGKGVAVRAGLDHVLAGNYSHVLLIDADFQHDPADIPRLLAAGESGGCDLVLAERTFVKGSMPTARFYSNRIGSWILSRFIGTDVADTQCGFRLVRTESLRTIRLTATGYELETEMLIKLVRQRAVLGHVDIAARYDGASSKLRSVRDTFRTCMMAVRYRYLSRD
jgi:glycosyltransferase involved in cell wall biosynthesis